MTLKNLKMPKLLAIFCLLAASVPAAAVRAAPADRPNIVFILADDLGYGDLSCYNPASKIPTPNLDRLASEGMRFTDAQSPSAVCTPTRYALLTGRYAWRSRLQRGVLMPWGEPLIAADRMTVASLLAEHGYRTGCFGKWHLGFDWPTRDGQPAASGGDRLSNVDFTKPLGNGPITRGFGEYFGVDLPNFPPYCFIDNDRTVGIPSAPNRPEFNRPGPMLPGWQWVDIVPTVNQRAVKFIEQNSAAPFFLYLPLTAPHFPVVPAADFKGRSQAGDYGDFVAQVDDAVGQIVAALDRAGVADNTLIFFTSDNGPEVTNEVKPGVYDRAREYGHYSMGPLRGAKRDLWEGGHRVPFIARWPGKIARGVQNEQTICHVDLLATVAELLNVPLPSNAGEDSYSLLITLTRKEPPKPTKPMRTATVHHSGSGRFAIRQGNWVYIVAPGGEDNGQPNVGVEPAWFKQERGYGASEPGPALYNLREDLPQRVNRLADEPKVAARLEALLAQYIAEGRSTPGEPQQNDVAVETGAKPRK